MKKRFAVRFIFRVEMLHKKAFKRLLKYAADGGLRMMMEWREIT
jgi:effector-binding domain-containing protein